jgi:tetratricopeptide (TPR) repeat protein
MRSLLIASTLLLVLSESLFSQSDMITLDMKTYEYYVKGDYKNLMNTGDSMLSNGIDYYYLRMRMGILAFNKQRYANAFRHFSKAIEFIPLDTISREYIYSSFLLAGRYTDAGLYHEKIPWDLKSHILKMLKEPGLSVVYVGSTASVYDQTLYKTNDLFYEAVESSLSINTGIEGYLSTHFKGNVALTNFRKTGTYYSSYYPSGTDIEFSQNQVYGKLTGCIFPGWEFSGFSHLAFYKNGSDPQNMGNNAELNQTKTEYNFGLGVTKNGWKIRSGVNFSYSNFSNFNSSKQARVEGFVTYLPLANLNLYLTTGGMYQIDNNWGETYQINQELGFKALNFLWFETGFIMGNSFLYARDQGLVLNNSYQIPAATAYGNFVFLLGKQFTATLTPFYCKYQIYSWDLNNYSRTDRQLINSLGGTVKLTYKIN